MVFEKVKGVTDRHLQNVKDAFTPIEDIQSLRVVSVATAFLTGDDHIGKKLHFYFNSARSGALFATPSLFIKRETPLLVTPGPCLGAIGKDIADLIEHLGVGGRIGTGRPADGRLVDINYPFDSLPTFQGFMGT